VIAFVFLMSAALAVASPEAQAEPDVPGDYAELMRIRAELAKPSRYPRLLNSADVAKAMTYPGQAVSKDQQGRTITWLLVGTDGAVKRCGIMVSSGSSMLDSKACQILIATAKFAPAEGDGGTPIDGIFQQPIFWRLEDDNSELIAAGEELKRMEKTLGRPARKAKLLNADEVATSMDYPVDSVRSGEEGAARALLLVGPDGNVERCGIEESSGFANLDTQTCNLLVAHARFRPATSRKGKPVEDVYAQRLVWKLQASAPVLEHDVGSRSTLIVAHDKHIRDCQSQVFLDGRWSEGPPQFCKNLISSDTGLVMAVAQSSDAYEPVVVFETWIAATGERPIPDLGRGEGEKLFALRSATATFGADGSRLSCTPGESVGVPEAEANPCEVPAIGLPDQLQPAPEKPLRTVRFESAIYLEGESQ
jgi:TonB family protein